MDNIEASLKYLELLTGGRNAHMGVYTRIEKIRDHIEKLLMSGTDDSAMTVTSIPRKLRESAEDELYINSRCACRSEHPMTLRQKPNQGAPDPED